MPEESDTTAAANTATTEESTATEPQSFINPDYTFVEGWQEKSDFIPPEFKDRAVYKIPKDIKGVMKQLGHQDLLISRQGKGVMPPTDKSTPAEIEAFYKGIGRPDSSEEYKVTAPKGMEAVFADPFTKDALAAMHKAGYTQKQVDAAMTLYANRVAAGMEQQENQQAQQKIDAEATLRKTWGNNYDGNLLIANRVISENLDEADREEVLGIIGNNPKVALMLAKVGQALLEDKPPTVGSPVVTNVDSKIRELQTTPGYMNGELRRSNPAEHARITAELEKVFKAKYPEPQK